MGVHFYWLGEGDEEHKAPHESPPHLHLGKISWSAKWCTACGVVTNYTETRHVGGSEGQRDRAERCPACQQTTHVKLKAMFTWTKMQHLHQLRALAQTAPNQVVLQDECGGRYSASDFLQFLERNVPEGLHFQMNGEFFYVFTFSL